jgi:Major Facilitator Superfamily
VESPLKSSRLRRILASYTVNRLGTWFGVIALMVAVFEQTHSALAVAALLFAGQALPAFIVPAVVARVEASGRGSELSGLYLFEALVTASLAVLLWHFWLPAVLLLAALDGTAALAASALLRAELARAARSSAEGQPERAGAHESSEDLAHEAERRANAALNVSFAGTFVLGPAIAGAVVAAAGAPAALFIDVGSFLIGGALLIDLHAYVEEVEGNSVGARLSAAWRYVSQAPVLRGLLLMYAIALVFLESAAPIEVDYAKTTLRAGDRGFGLLLTSWGIGAVLGSVIFARAMRRPLGALLGAGAFGIGLAYLGFAAAPSLALACAAALVGGVGNGLEVPSLMSLVQQLSPQRLHGRLLGGVESLDAFCLAVGLPLGGALAVISSPREAFLVVGVGATIASAALFRLALKGAVRAANRDPSAPARALAGEPPAKSVPHQPASQEPAPEANRPL